MATIRKRGPYQWEAQIRKKGYPAQSKTTSTKAEAEAWAKMIESEMSRGVWLSRGESESTTLGEALDRYLVEVVPGKKGQAREVSHIRQLKALPLSNRTLASIRGADIAKQRDSWLKHQTPATVVRRLALLSHVFNVARKEWGMENLSNPVEVVRKPSVHNARVRRVQELPDNPEHSIQNGEIERIIAASGSELLPNVITIALETAMRRGEITSLLWENINLSHRVAHLPETKNGNARDVPLSSKAVAVFEKISKPESRQGAVFNMTADAITRAFERALQRARKAYEHECTQSKMPPVEAFLRNLRFHDLRHEATSRLAEIFPMHELTKITGHKDPRMLMRYYHQKAEILASKLP